MIRIVSSIFCIFFASSLQAQSVNGITPLPLPKNLRIESSGPRGKIWEKLTAQQKSLVFHLTEAGRAGRTLLIHQTHRHAIAIRQMLVQALSQNHLADTKVLLGVDGFSEFVTYAAKFLDQAGPYAGSNRKYILSKVSAEQVEELFKIYSPKLAPQFRTEAVRLLTHPEFEVLQYPENQEGAGLEFTGGNLYEHGVTGEEVRGAIGTTLKSDLNCRVVRSLEGVTCEVQKVSTPGIVGTTLNRVIHHLRLAKIYTSTDQQKAQIEFMIRYFSSGDIEDFRQANIAWVKDGANSTVDFMNGWVEIYEDWLGKIASWESYVQVVDPEVSKLAQGLARHAQYFEDAMPYGEWKKKFPPGYAPPAIMVYYFQESASFRSGGYNLPNFDDIRRDVGAKNVIRLPMPGESTDAGFQAMWREVLTEFLPTAKVEDALSNREKIWRTLVLLHEIIGHGSGTYDITKYAKNEDPVSALGPLGSALEEQRADLTAMVFVSDPKLVGVGIYKDQNEADQIRKLTYDFYVGDFLRRTSGQRTFTEAHQRGHWLFINHLLENGAIGWVAKDGSATFTPENGVLMVKDYDKFEKGARDLLGELQLIKATRLETQLKALFAKYAPLDDIDQPWAKAIIGRGQNLKINAGYVEQPWRITQSGEYQTFGGDTLESIAPYLER